MMDENVQALTYSDLIWEGRVLSRFANHNDHGYRVPTQRELPWQLVRAV
jgi:hypothetical protein